MFHVNEQNQRFLKLRYSTPQAIQYTVHKDGGILLAMNIAPYSSSSSLETHIMKTERKVRISPTWAKSQLSPSSAL
jgi:hypothetical protein